MRKSKSVGGTNVSLSLREMVSNVAKRLVTERADFILHHALSVTFGDSSPEGVSLTFMRYVGLKFCGSLNLFVVQYIAFPLRGRWIAQRDE